MKGTGLTIEPTVEVDSSTPMEMSMRDSGKMTKLTGKESILKAMGQVILVSGMRTSSMAMAFKGGLMARHMKGITLVYTRQHCEGSKQGKGKFTWPDGSIYDGNFENNMMEGFGKIMWIDKKEYEGHWKDNKMHGKGIFKWPDGRIYEGDYYDDKKHGFGRVWWPDGREYEG